jgi:hypothetical protein
MAVMNEVTEVLHKIEAKLYPNYLGQGRRRVCRPEQGRSRPKGYAFWLGSLRYAQTPTMYGVSAKPKLRGNSVYRIAHLRVSKESGRLYRAV